MDRTDVVVLFLTVLPLICVLIGSYIVLKNVQ
jgi:TM2 domain-containing membrane protein YozV